MDEEQLKDMILHSLVSISGGWEHGGHVLGIMQVLEYLTHIAQDEETDAFVDSINSLNLHLHWMHTPPNVQVCVNTLIEESMLANGVPEEYATTLMHKGTLQFEDYVHRGAMMVSPGWFQFDEGDVQGAEQLLGLQGAQFIIDVSRMTQDQVGVYHPPPEGEEDEEDVDYPN